MTSEALLLDQDGAVLRVTLNRPASRNALNSALTQSLIDTMNDANSRDEVRAVVLTGEGPVFCAGADLKEVSLSSPRAVRDRVAMTADLYRSLLGFQKPLIAAVQGPAVGGGCGLAMACDFVFASPDAFFSYPEVPRGLVPATVSVTLGRIVNRRLALDLLLTGRRVAAEDAVKFGMINEVVSPNDLQSRAVEVAHKLALHDSGAVALTKELYNQVSEYPTSIGLELAKFANLAGRQFSSAREGAADFLSRDR